VVCSDPIPQISLLLSWCFSGPLGTLGAFCASGPWRARRLQSGTNRKGKMMTNIQGYPRIICYSRNRWEILRNKKWSHHGLPWCCFNRSIQNHAMRGDYRLCWIEGYRLNHQLIETIFETSTICIQLSYMELWVLSDTFRIFQIHMLADLGGCIIPGTFRKPHFGFWNCFCIVRPRPAMRCPCASYILHHLWLTWLIFRMNQKWVPYTNTGQCYKHLQTFSKPCSFSPKLRPVPV
jgi:hypothetical protein